MLMWKNLRPPIVGTCLVIFAPVRDSQGLEQTRYTAPSQTILGLQEYGVSVIFFGGKKSVRVGMEQGLQSSMTVTVVSPVVKTSGSLVDSVDVPRFTDALYYTSTLTLSWRL
ncbi:hypothetical protein N0V94_007177 [Neodidymelliopsis sp. IMI 364377]|nr:hypothetical protein N0V94_007177 [Neodidymelliopsis sp. IMI 364377]